MLTLHCTGAHKFKNGVRTEFFKELETTGKNHVLPTNADEFQKMLELVLYDASAFALHHRMRKALVGMQLPLYSQFRKSE